MNDIQEVSLPDESIVLSAESLPIDKTVIWYLLGSAAAYYLMVMGGNQSKFISLLLGAFFLAILIPLPHVIIALAFKRKRNMASTMRIYRGWHIGLVIFCAVGTIAEYFNGELTKLNKMDEATRVTSRVNASPMDAGSTNSDKSNADLAAMRTKTQSVPEQGYASSQEESDESMDTCSKYDFVEQGNTSNTRYKLP